MRDEVSSEMKDLQRKVYALKMGVILPTSESNMNTSRRVIHKIPVKELIQ